MHKKYWQNPSPNKELPRTLLTQRGTRGSTIRKPAPHRARALGPQPPLRFPPFTLCALRKYLYPVLLLVFGALVAAIYVFKKPDLHSPELRERHGSLALGGEWVNTKNAIQGLLAKLRQDPKDQKSRLLLAQAYMQEGRVTGDHP